MVRSPMSWGLGFALLISGSLGKALSLPIPSQPPGAASGVGHSAGMKALLMPPGCAWRTAGGGWAVVTCASWNTCTVTIYDSNWVPITSESVTPDWCS